MFKNKVLDKFIIIMLTISVNVEGALMAGADYSFLPGAGGKLTIWAMSVNFFLPPSKMFPLPMRGQSYNKGGPGAIFYLS